MKAAFEFAVSKGCEIIIISDANTFYIETITEAKQIKSYITRVITNPMHKDNEGRLSILRHTTQEHGCQRCAVNLCKGREILLHIEQYGPYDQIIYAGDGKNDFCPGTKLRANDVLLARKNRALTRMLGETEYRSLISCQVVEWDIASHVLDALQLVLQ